MKNSFALRHKIGEQVFEEYQGSGGTWSYATMKLILNNASVFDKQSTFTFIKKFIELMSNEHSPRQMYKAAQLFRLLKDNKFPFFNNVMNLNINKISRFIDLNSTDPLMIAAAEIMTKTVIDVETNDVKLKISDMKGNPLVRKKRNLSAEKNKRPTFVDPIKHNGSKRRIICYSPQPYISL